jgi:GT2 family glycosyltransferase/glycosyltransferase involved in cell wall biosynthesis/uncharacterized protein (DUF3084 family)
MKSLLVTTELFNIGGLETHVAGEVACLAEEGFRIHLVVGANTSDKMLPKEATSVTTGLAMGPDMTTAELIQTVESLRKIIRAHGVECVHAHPFMSLVPSQIAAELEGIPFVVTLHGPASLSDCYGPLYDFILSSVILPKADMVVAVSQEVADLAAPYVDDARLCVLPNGVPIGNFCDDPVEDCADGRWLLVSRLDIHKVVGIRDFIQKAAAAGLPGVLIVGDGDARGKLLSQLDVDGLSNYVEFLGARTDVAKLMQRAAGVAGMGRVILEGLACSKPAVLVGYDGVKGVVTPDVFRVASATNFSGRKMPTISATEFSRQLSMTQRGTNELTDLVMSEYNDKAVWRKFVQKLDGLKTHGRSLLSDAYIKFASETNAPAEAYLHSHAWFEQFGRLAHSLKHFDQSVVANFYYTQKRYMDDRMVMQIASLNQAVAERDRQITSLNQAVAERDGQIASLNQAVVERDGQITSLNQAVAERDGQIVSLNHAVAERDGQIASLNQAVAERDGQITSLSEAVTVRDGQIASLNQAVAERDGQITSLNQAVAERDGQIASLNQAVAERDGQIASLSEAVTVRDGQIASLNQALVERDRQIASLNQAVAERDGQIASLNEAVTEREVRINSLNQAVAERDGQIASLNEAVTEREVRINSLNQAVAERDGQIASLNQAVAERDGQIASQYAQLMTFSNWASSIDKHPLKHAFKKTALGIARGTLRSMPVSIATKQRLRDVFFSTIRPLRQSVRRKSAQVRPADEAAPPRGQRPSAGVARDVFVFAVIDWHFRIQRPQHIARSLAESGHRVFYFSNHFVDADEPGYQLERLPGADALYQVKLHVKGAPAIYFDPPSDQALAMLTRSIAKVIQDFSALSSLSIVQHAYWYPLVKRLPNSYRIYDCMDHHEGFGNVPAKLVEIEKEMLCSADLVTVTSSWLEDFARKHNPSVALVRNAAEYRHFVTRPEQVYKDGKGRRIIGYYGAIAEWFDIDLVRTIALEYPDCLILLVGNDTVGAQKVLADLPNVEFTGEVPYATLPFYLHAFDVCLLPFKVIPLTLATNPVKVYEYLAAGKPVVCVDLPEVGQFGDLVSRACSTDDFVALVGASLQESGVLAEQKSAERRRFASEQTWCHRGAELATALKAVRMPRVSVIILTFNNLDLTRACLDSVLERSDYPNLEVIVVDNASSDGTSAYLEDFARRHPDVRVVLNRENLGFAAGNNVGLSIATGDYLVVLNNDTVVTQGWVMTLLRHFQNDPSLGIVGPVTNNIGNEARIETRYQSIAEMPGEALRYTLANMGKTYPMRTVAFFCVMFPRSVYELCGPICEDYGLGFFEDDDYCRRVESIGKRVVCAEDVFIHHHLSASFNKLKDSERQELFRQNKEVYEKKWGAWVPHSYRNY